MKGSVDCGRGKTMLIYVVPLRALANIPRAVANTDTKQLTFIIN